MIVRDKDFVKEYIKVWDDGAEKDAPFITTGLKSVLKDFYGDFLNSPPPFPVKKGSMVLDLGCGWCRMLKQVLDRGATGIGIDISEKMLDLSVDYLKKNKHNPVLVRGDGTLLPFRDDSFDMVYSLLVLQHLSKKNGKEVFNEISRVLKPGGESYILIPGRFAPENLLFSFLQFVSKNILRVKDPIRMRFYRIGEARKICKRLFSDFEVTAHEFRPPWNFHTRWTWHLIIIPKRFHKTVKRISDRLERIANNRFPFLKHFGVVLIIRVIK